MLGFLPHSSNAFHDSPVMVMWRLCHKKVTVCIYTITAWVLSVTYMHYQLHSTWTSAQGQPRLPPLIFTLHLQFLHHQTWHRDIISNAPSSLKQKAPLETSIVDSVCVDSRTVVEPPSSSLESSTVLWKRNWTSKCIIPIVCTERPSVVIRHEVSSIPGVTTHVDRIVPLLVVQPVGVVLARDPTSVNGQQFESQPVLTAAGQLVDLFQTHPKVSVVASKSGFVFRPGAVEI